MGFINWVGVALEVCGLAMSGVGLWGTWHEFAPPGERFVGPLVDTTRAALAAVRAKVKTLVRRLLRRPPEPIVVQVGGVGVLTSTGRVSVRLGYGNLSDDVAAALAELHRRTQDLMDRHTQVDEKLADEAEARGLAIKEIRAEFASAVGRLEAREQRIAVGGIRLQSVGLLLVALGLVLQAWR